MIGKQPVTGDWSLFFGGRILVLTYHESRYCKKLCSQKKKKTPLGLKIFCRRQCLSINLARKFADIKQKLILRLLNRTIPKFKMKFKYFLKSQCDIHISMLVQYWPT